MNIGYAFAKRRQHRKPRPDCNGRGRLMGLPKIDGGCTVVAWNTRTANFFPRHNLAVHLHPNPFFSPTDDRPPWFFLRAFAACTPSPFFPSPLEKSLPTREPASREKYRLTRLHRLSRDYRVRAKIFSFTRGRKSFPSIREKKRAVSVPRFEMTWPRMGWNLWRKRSRTRI